MTGSLKVHKDVEQQPQATERRQSERLHCCLQATCKAIAGPSHLACAARVTDISKEGLGLTAALPFEPGTILALELTPSPGAAPITKLLVVAHLRLRGARRWHMGGFFAHPLSQKQLKALL